MKRNTQGDRLNGLQQMNLCVHCMCILCFHTENKGEEVFEPQTKLYSKQLLAENRSIPPCAQPSLWIRLYDVLFFYNDLPCIFFPFPCLLLATLPLLYFFLPFYSPTIYFLFTIKFSCSSPFLSSLLLLRRKYNMSYSLQ